MAKIVIRVGSIAAKVWERSICKIGPCDFLGLGTMSSPLPRNAKLYVVTYTRMRMHAQYWQQ